jgi:hypothetical protein
MDNNIFDLDAAADLNASAYKRHSRIDRECAVVFR